jgi:hypothetical protein
VQVLKILGVLLMLAGAAATLYIFVQGAEEFGMSFNQAMRFIAPVFGLGALLVGVERLTSKMAVAKANKPAAKAEKPVTKPAAAKPAAAPAGKKEEPKK